MIENREIFLRDRTLIYLKKNKDYGNSFTGALDKFGIVAFQIIAKFKVDRITSLMGKEESKEVDESLEDSIRDLFNYAVMAQMWEESLSSIVDFVGIADEFIGTEDKFIEFERYLRDKQVENVNDLAPLFKL